MKELPKNITRMNAREMYRVAVEMGCTATVVIGTGDCRLTHRLMEKPVKFNVRRKDSTRAVGCWLRALDRKIRESRPDAP